MPGEEWAGPAGSGRHQNEDGVSCVEQSGCVLQMACRKERHQLLRKHLGSCFF